jgi:hypothetical protein
VVTVSSLQAKQTDESKQAEPAPFTMVVAIRRCVRTIRIVVRLLS